MKRMKLWLSLVLAAALMTGFGACASSDEGGDGPGTDEELEVAYLVDNFEDPDDEEFCDSTFEQSGDWFTYITEFAGNEITPSPDDPDGTKPFCADGLVEGGANGTNYSLRVTGTSAPGSYGVGVGNYMEWDETASKMVPRDFSGNEGFMFYAKGIGSIKVSVNMMDLSSSAEGGNCDEETNDQCFNFHAVTVNVDSNDFERHAYDFSSFVQEDWGGTPVALDLTQVAGFQFHFPAEATANGNFEVWIDEVAVYGGEPWDGVTGK